MFYKKEECYTDMYLSLTLGVIQEYDIALLVDYYKNLEHYECCQGIVEAYADYKKNNKTQKQEL
jgi:hypothetical protein